VLEPSGVRVARLAARRRGAPVRLIPFPRRSLDVDGLYRRHSGVVFRRARRFFDEEEAREVMHEVFLKVIEKQHTFRAEASPTTWLYQMTTNHCLNRLRDRKRRAEKLELNAELPWLKPSGPADAETAVFLEQLWTDLDEELVAIAVYYFIDGMTHSEIAEVAGTSRRTIGNRIEEIRRLATKAAGINQGDQA
jgi:RNA polymerase sigma factor (sigma-70 family)